MNRDSNGRFCKANKIKSTKIPFLSNIAMHRKNPVKAKEILDKLKEEMEWECLGNEINLDEIDEPIIVHVKIKEKERFDDCINNACIFDRLDWDERAKFMEALFNDGKSFTEICNFMYETCTIAHPTPLKDGSGCRIMSCNGCFTNWFFNMYTPEVFHKILGD